MAINKGWIKLDRKLLTSKIWDSGKPFDERSAWIDLLLMAAHKDTPYCKRGEIVTSIGELERRWKWGRNRVYRFLRNNQVKINGTPNGTTITIENYAKYQGERSTNGTPNGTPSGTPNGTTDGTQTRILLNNNNINNITKNDKNDKEGKCASGDSVLVGSEEYHDPIEDVTYPGAKERLIEKRKQWKAVNEKWKEKN